MVSTEIIKNWGGAKWGAENNFWGGICPPLPPPGAATVICTMFAPFLIILYFFKVPVPEIPGFPNTRLNFSFVFFSQNSLKFSLKSYKVGLNDVLQCDKQQRNKPMSGSPTFDIKRTETGRI